MCDITPVRRCLITSRGVEFAGKIIPVADLRIKFRLARVANTELTCIVVVQVTLPDKERDDDGVDRGCGGGSVEHRGGDIEPTPDFGTAINTDYILGLAKVKGTVKALDIDHVVLGDHVAQITKVVALAN